MTRSRDQHRPTGLAGGLLAALLFTLPALADAQDFTPLAVSTAQAVDQSVLETPRLATPTRLTFGLPAKPHVSFVMQSLYATTALVQGLDAQSTFKALNAGAVEANSIVRPFAANRPAFIALKAGMAAAFIYAGHDLSTRHKIGAIVALGLVNSVYTAIAIHNYRIVHAMDVQR